MNCAGRRRRANNSRGTELRRQTRPIRNPLPARRGWHGRFWRLQRAPEARWFRQSPTFKALPPDFLSPADQRDFVLVVQWRRLLAKALLQHPSAADVPPALRRLAHRAWWTLQPLLEQHDVVLAQLLKAAQRNFRENPERAKFEPLWVGFDTEADERRFDAQEVTVIKDFEGTSSAAVRSFLERVRDAGRGVGA